MSLVERANQLLAALLSNPNVVFKDADDTRSRRAAPAIQDIFYAGEYWVPANLAVKLAQDLERC
jgi:hypothetical protein